MKLTGTCFNQIQDKKNIKSKTMYKIEPSKSYFNYSMSDLNNYDIDSIKEELIKTKNELNKLNQDYQDLKISYSKLENECRGNVKLIENLFDEGNTNRIANNINSDDNNNNNNNIDQETEQNIKMIKDNISKKLKKQAKEKLINQKMKIELLDLREQIKEKDIIINNLIVNSKISKVQDLDDKYSKTYQELLEVSEKYSKAQEIEKEYGELKNETNILNQQLDYYKNQSIIQKEKLTKMNTTISNYKKEQEMSTINGNLTDRRKKNNLQSVSELYKKQLDERDKTIKQLNQQIELMKKKEETNQNNTEKNEKKEKDLEEKCKKYNEQIKQLKEENKEQKSEIEKLEKNNFEAYIKIDK